MNQNSRQKASSSDERDFCKLLNNANFGSACCNNLHNCIFETTYNAIRKYESIFNNKKFSDFSDINLMKEEIEQKYFELFLALDPRDSIFEARKYFLNNRKQEDLDAINSMNEHKKKTGRRGTFYHIEDKIESALKSRTTKMLIDFDVEESVSIKSLALKKNDPVKITTRFLAEKMLCLLNSPS